MDIPISFPDLTPYTALSFTSAYPTPFPCNSVSSAKGLRNTISTGVGVGGRTRRLRDPPSELRRTEEDGGGSGERLKRPQTSTREREKEELRRALLGMEDDVSDQEDYVYRSDMTIKHFGQDFLLPIGRRQTQHEFDTASSPTPSDVQEHEHRQEDPEGLATPPEVNNGDGDSDDEDGRAGGSPMMPVERDLDAEMEDRDEDEDEGDEEEEEMTG